MTRDPGSPRPYPAAEGAWHDAQMEPETADHCAELLELRRRVFGPRPDLAQDPRAHARLAALEAALASEAVQEQDQEPPALWQPAGSPAPPVSSAPHAPAPAPEPRGTADQGGSVSAPARRFTPRTLRAAWGASLLVAVVGAAAATLLLTRGEGDTVAVLPLRGLTDDAADPSGDFDDGAVLIAEFLGLTVSRLPGDPTGPQLTEDCLSVLPSGTDPGTVVGAYGCGAGSVPAAVPMNVTPDLPSELRDAFPAGTTLLFTLEGDAVRVSRVGG